VDVLAERHRARPVTTGPVGEAIATESSATITGGGALVRVRGNASPRFKGSRTLRSGGTIGRLPPTWAIIISGLAVLVAVVGIIAVPRILDGNTAKEYNSLVDAALQNVAIAQTLPDATERRTHLRDALAMLLEARELPEASADLERDLERVRAALAELDAILTPALVQSFANLEQFGDQPVSAKRIHVHNGAAYLLDTAGGQVIAVDLDSGQARAVYTPGSEGRGRAVATAWVSDSHLGEPSLLIADSNRALWAYSPNAGLRSVPFGAGTSMSVLDIAIHNDDLYVLDNAGAAVWRLLAGEGGYLSPVRVLEAPELANAQRLMVDSEIITSHTDGTIHRFAGELALELSEAGIDMRLTSPEPPQALVQGEIAVADPAHNRIVVLRRDGTFDRQYRHDDFAGLTGFSLTPDGAWIFSGGHLRRVTW
jgi:hypothetical protein